MTYSDENSDCRQCSRVISVEDGDPVYKCHDCLGAPILCRNCTESRHQFLPYHRIKVHGFLIQGFILKLTHSSIYGKGVIGRLLRFPTSGARIISVMAGGPVCLRQDETTSPSCIATGSTKLMWCIAAAPLTVKIFLFKTNCFAFDYSRLLRIYRRQLLHSNHSTCYHILVLKGSYRYITSTFR